MYDFAAPFRDRPEILSSILQNDFGIKPLNSHRLRATLMCMVERIYQTSKTTSHYSELATIDQYHDLPHKSGVSHDYTSSLSSHGSDSNYDSVVEIESNIKHEITQPLFRSVVVNEAQKNRFEESKKRNIKQDQSSNSHYWNNMKGNTYGLPSNYVAFYPTLASELDNFLTFMVTPSTLSQESPIRMATAKVYLCHAKLYLGWYLKQNRKQYEDPNVNQNKKLSLFEIIPSKEVKSAQNILEYILWLRNERCVSDSYEANILRGLTKLVKFRFAHESKADTSYGEKSFDDIPVVRELRKLHVDAEQRRALGPRSSNEDQKWISWTQYLEVVEALKVDVLADIEAYKKLTSSDHKKFKTTTAKMSTKKRVIAQKFQAFLVLAFFSCIPDRQRTFRELEIGRNLIFNKKEGCWTIKHRPDDYKTGKAYGDRPPLVLAKELTPSIDDFLQNWRPSLDPKGSHFFVQIRTGKALSSNNIYNIVARSCYKHTGKKTNPHLLRDIVVTHVRSSQASEKELEALAIYMGHSISVQRNSYDRRTKEQKVAPAVDLLKSINSSR
eukprot:CAMPEP_0184868390 /NCGR_PEP_ID=MMETSP0580-20130426/30247_1 /TAXON_ID=1118495 /ORGANISM="Dactyliosolen fragilissimus" /LENGTH=554 /DNA_ID=CAMNT_0027369241 /DNA_START=296 /DNA_END=1960 /DNA_ORIENTATION=+